MPTRTIAVVLPPGPHALVRLNGPTANYWYSMSTRTLLDELEYAPLEADTGLGATHLEITRDGYQPFSHHLDLHQPAEDQQIRVGVAADPGRPDDIILDGMTRDAPLVIPLPAPPSRAQLVDYRTHFQGLDYVTERWGTFRAAFLETIGRIAPDDFQRCLAAHKAAVGPQHPNGDTHVIMNVSGSYHEPSVLYPAELLSGSDFTNDLPLFKSIVRQAVVAGLFVDVRLAGDGMSASAAPAHGEYNDPVGSTYGYEWLMNNFERIATALRGDVGSACPDGEDLTKYIVFCPGYDAVFYGWGRAGEPDQQPQRVAAFGRLFRSILPYGVLAIEHDMGHIPVGGGSSDYFTGGKMSDYDIVMGEFPNGLERSADPNPDTNRGCQTWMVTSRMVRPWRRPDDMPPLGRVFDAAGNDRWDPHPPFYLAPSSPRGPYVYVAFEFSKYLESHGRGYSIAETEACRAYLAAMGCTNVG